MRPIDMAVAAGPLGPGEHVQIGPWDVALRRAGEPPGSDQPKPVAGDLPGDVTGPFVVA